MRMGEAVNDVETIFLSGFIGRVFVFNFYAAIGKMVV